MPDETSAPPVKKIVYLNRRVAFIEPHRINVRPALAAALFPLFGLLVGAAAFVSILLWVGSMPFWLTLVLLGVAVMSLPLAGIGFVYTIAGTDVVFEKEKQSGVWQQGFLGMGVGTTELVPFWKIHEIRIEEVTRGRQQGQLQDLAQLEIVLVKESGKRLRIGDTIVARSMVREGLADVMEVAQAIADMTRKPLIAPTVVRRRRVLEEEPATDQARAETAPVEDGASATADAR
jgi:hypothetical protein